MTFDNILNLPYAPYLGPKRSRAAGPTCRTAIVKRFLPEYRAIVVQILVDPENNASLLTQLMAPYPDVVERTGFKHGCLCCPQAARCQSAQKIDRHLRGLFNIRAFPCQFWSVHRPSDEVKLTELV
jgi:hypothetical protein